MKEFPQPIIELRPIGQVSRELHVPIDKIMDLVERDLIPYEKRGSQIRNYYVPVRYVRTLLINPKRRGW